MLTELRLKDFALADSLVFEPESGLLAVTGETGSGKSILVNALAFVTGQRSTPEFVRTGADRCQVTAVFRVSTPAPFDEWLEGSEPELILRRELRSEGKSRGWINDRPVSLAALKRAGAQLCDLHAQNQHQGLLDSESHAAFLDMFLRGEAKAFYETAFDQWTVCRDALSAHREKFHSSLEQKDFWEFQRSELERVNPLPGEYEELEARRSRLRDGVERSRLHHGLWLELTDPEAGLVPRLARLLTQLEGTGTSAWGPHVRGAIENLQEVERALGRSALEPERENASLDLLEARLHALYGLKKKFGGSLEAALAEREKLAKNLEFLELAEQEQRRLEREEAEAATRLREAAQTLVEARRKAEARMRKALEEPLSDLALGSDPVSVQQDDQPFEAWTRSGPTHVEFLLSANPGERPKPLAKIASGGELSRILLGFKSVAPGAQKVETLVFDEIDSGIGGATASRVAQRLKALSTGRQVIVITHLRQIAELSDRHVEVRKVSRDGRHVPELRTLRANEREAALARLMHGDTADPGGERGTRTAARPGRSD